MNIDMEDHELIKKLNEAAQKGEVRFNDRSGKTIVLSVAQLLPGQIAGEFGERDPASHIFAQQQGR